MRARTVTVLAILVIFSLLADAANITLVKHARRVRVPETNQYVVKEGDTLSKILVEVYHAKQEDLPYLYRQFRLQNPSIENLNNLMIGTKITIPLVGSIKEASDKKKGPPEVEMKQLSPNEYIIKQGEHLAKILRDVYGIPNELVYRQYIALIKQMNPEITNPDYIRAGQKLKLPDVRQVISAAKEAQSQPNSQASETSPEIPAARGGQDLSGPAGGGTAQGASSGEASSATRPSPATAKAPGRAQDEKMVKGAMLPALKSMGGTKRDSGMYFMPFAGGTSLSIDTSEIPVMELDTGRKIIFDVKGTITPEMKGFIEKAFPSFTVISGPPGDLEGLMDKVLSVSGYFSINKDASPLLVGEEEKLRFYGKWIVYKDFSRSNVFVVNLLKDSEVKTPEVIRNYAGHFGIDLIEIGGKNPQNVQQKPVQVVDLKGSYTALLKHFKIPHEVNTEIKLMSSGVVTISYKAPVLVDRLILTPVMPPPEMASMLQNQSYEVMNTSEVKLDEVLDALGQEFDGPPVKLTVAQGRTELEVPGLRLGNQIILLQRVNRKILSYLSASGLKVITW